MRPWLAAAGVALLLACAGPQALPPAGGTAAAMDFRVTSPAFADGARIPVRFTADGADLSPPLVLTAPPAGTVSLALVVDDPDAPVGIWTHWLVWGLPAATRSIAEGSLPGRAVEGRNSWGDTGWGGPSPPSGTHRYVFTVYALDARLDLPQGSGRAELERAMAGHVLATTRLVGTYSR